jgi:hypothetical protein
MATVRKRGDKWQAQIRKLGHAPVSRSFLLKKDAEAWARQSEHAIDVGEAGLTSVRTKDRTPLAAVLRHFLENITPLKRSARTERSKITMMQRQPIAAKAVVDVSPTDIAAFRDLGLKTVSTETVRQDLVLVRRVFEHARKECGQRLRSNPCDNVEKPRSAPARTRRLSSDDAVKLAQALSVAKGSRPCGAWRFQVPRSSA